jgi:SAM-dependent methyltransferase
MTEGTSEAMYESFAKHFAAETGDNSYNARYDRPSMLALIGSVEDLDVLDAGCGPGFYTEALLDAGARVTAIDVSPSMVRLTRERVGDRADIRVADLERPLEWLADDSQDLVVLALVLHHLDDCPQTLAEFRRVLRPGGHLVLSTVHPMEDWRRLGGGYFDRERIVETWNDGWQVAFWRKPLQAWCDAFADAGFLIERLVEPLPEESMRLSDPDTYAKLRHAPAFIAFRLLSP